MSYLSFFDQAKIWVTPRVQDILPDWYFPPRTSRFRAYCVGGPKTGTTTISLLFADHYRSAHEPEASLVLKKVLNFMEGEISQTQLSSYIRKRDKRLNLEVDSSHLNLPLIETLTAEFKDAKFILTIRDCYSWLDSLLNHHAPAYQLLGNTKRFRNSKWTRFYNYIFGFQKFNHSKEETFLIDRNLYTLDGYFSYWANHNQKIISTVPKENLIIIKTQEINHSLSKLEDFLGIPENTLNKKAHGNIRQSHHKLNLLSKIDQSFLEEKANFYCQDLMNYFFPSIKNSKDAGIGIS